MIQVQYKKNTSMIQVREGDPNTLLKTYRPKKKTYRPNIQSRERREHLIEPAED